MPIRDTVITVAGNLTADPELRYTGVSRGFGISEVLVVVNWRPETVW